MTKPKQKKPIYIPADFYMLRAPVLPAQNFIRLATVGHVSPETSSEDLDRILQSKREECHTLLTELASQAQIAQALTVASPSLQKGWEDLLRGEGSPARRKRVYASLLRYLIRMSTRPTPFGLFSGVALGTLASSTHVHLASPPIERFRSRSDMSWVLAVLKQLEGKRELVSQLHMQINQTAYIVGSRAVLPFADTYGEQDSRTISLRVTPAVQKVFELARLFIPYAELHVSLQQAFPNAAVEQIEHLLWQLWEYGFLISHLHPPLTEARPVEYIAQRLKSLSGMDQQRENLQHVLEKTEELDRAGIGASLRLFDAVLQTQNNALVETNRDREAERMPLQVDTALHLKKPLLNHSIGEIAARAGEFLLRQTPAPKGSHALQEYRALFIEKYGNAEVPLLDLISPENGLDAPAGYEKPPRVYPRSFRNQYPDNGPRARLLLKLITEAINKRSLEVELTEEIQQGLETWSPNAAEAPLTLEIYLQVHAQSREALDHGEWTAVVGRNCGSPDGGRTFGRFFDLLGAPGMEVLRDFFLREEALLPDVIFAELSYQPLQARKANLAIRPPLRAYEIAVGTTPSVSPENVLSLNDLVVGIQDGHFYLRSLRLGKQVRVCQTHMLNVLSAPNVCRFITEIAHDNQPALTPFDWGAFASAPFLPRLVIKASPATRLVIEPAQWRLQKGMVFPSGTGSEEARWFRGLQEWRKQWRVPRYVYLTEMDNRLLLDLEHPLFVTMLYDELNKLNESNQVRLEELLPDFEHLWLRDEQDKSYFSEIVVPLLRAGTDDLALNSPTRKEPFTSPKRIIPPTERNRFPGEEWVYLKVYAAPNQHEGLIADPLYELVHTLQEQELIDRWFFIRYGDPEPHLRLRFRAKSVSNVQSLLAMALPWSLQLAKCGQIQRYALDTYEREVERYGGPEAIDLLEQVFTVDSDRVRSLIAAQYVHHLTLDPLAVAVFTLDHFFAAYGWDFTQRLDWTHNSSEKYAFSKSYYSERKTYCDLLAPSHQLDPTLAEQRSLLLKLMEPTKVHLSTLASQVHQIAEAGSLWVPEKSLMSSLAHMHINRLLGINMLREQQVYAFWRHTLDSLEHRSH